MPELPEVETLAADLRERLPGARIRSVQVLWARCLERVQPTEFVAWLTGRSVLEVRRRGKYLWLVLDCNWHLLIHLRMSGRLRVTRTEMADEPHLRLMMGLEDGRSLAFCDPRKFGRVFLTQDAEQVLCRLGPEPLSAAFTAPFFRDRLASHEGSLKPLLLNQSFVAGLGNIYADEALFAAGLHPLRKASALSFREMDALHAAITRVLAAAVENRGTTLSDEGYCDVEGKPGSNQVRLNVYRRSGEPCLVCGTEIQRLVVAGRGSHICPVCQRQPEQP